MKFVGKYLEFVWINLAVSKWRRTNVEKRKVHWPSSAMVQKVYKEEAQLGKVGFLWDSPTNCSVTYIYISRSKVFTCVLKTDYINILWEINKLGNMPPVSVWSLLGLKDIQRLQALSDWMTYLTVNIWMKCPCAEVYINNFHMVPGQLQQIWGNIIHVFWHVSYLFQCQK